MHARLGRVKAIESSLTSFVVFLVLFFVTLDKAGEYLLARSSKEKTLAEASVEAAILIVGEFAVGAISSKGGVDAA